MTRTRLTLLGLCAAVFAVMAFGASGAQATTGSNWLILDTNGTLLTGATLHAAFGGTIENNLGSLLTTIGGVSVEVLCTAGALINATMQANGSTNTGVKARFTGCSVDLEGVANPECEVHSIGKAVGTVETNPLHALLELHILVSGAKDDVIHVLPDSGLEIVKLLMGAACPIGEEVPIAGHLYLKDCQGNTSALTHKVTHLLEEFSQLTTLTALNQPATLMGSGNVVLAGTHVGLAWSGDPA